MGDTYSPPSAGETTANQLEALIKYLPQYSEALRGQILPTAQAQLDASSILTPQHYDALIRNYSQYGPQLSQISQDIKSRNQQSEIAADVAALQGPGRTAVTEAEALLRRTDPEYFQSRGLIADKMAEALKASSAEISPTERAEILRSIGRDTSQGPESQLDTISNAQRFGSAATAKANNLANVVNTVSQSLPALRSGADFYGIATGRAGLGINPGQQLFGQGSYRAGNEGLELGSDLYNNISQTELQRQRLKQSGDKRIIDDVFSGFSAVGDLVGGFMPG